MNRKSHWLIAEYQDSNNYLAHHGILGMKWGIRRYQNEDGSLTPEGERRYGNGGGTPKKFSWFSRRDFQNEENYGQPNNYSQTYEENYRKESGFKRATDSVKNFFTTTDENGRYKLSNKGKAVLIGAGATTASILAAVGIGALVKKAGGAKYLTKFTAMAANDVRTMDDVTLKKFAHYHRNMAFNIAAKRNMTGGKMTGPRNIQQLMRSTIATTVANSEYNKRTTINIARKLSNAPIDINDFANSKEGETMVKNIVKGSAGKTATALLSVGTAAVTGAVAYELKERLDEKDPTGVQSKYMAPNPNQKKK